MFAALDLQSWTVLATLGALLLLGLIVAGFLAVGLFKARSLIRREFTAYFLSPIAYVVFVVFLLVTAYLFSQTLELLTAAGPKGVEFPMQAMLGDVRFWLVLAFIPPLLTMRLFAEERGTGTLEMLMTTPLKDWQVVLSKYLAAFAFYVVLWLPTLAYLPVLVDMHQPILTPDWTTFSLLLVGGLGAVLLSFVLVVLPGGTAARLIALGLFLAGVVCAGFGGWAHYHLDPKPYLLEIPVGIDPSPVFVSYLGLALVGAMFLALGLLVSSLVRSQMIAALVSLVISLVFIMAGFWHTNLDATGEAYRALAFITVPLHFSQDFTRGLLDSRHVILYGSVALFSLFLTVRSLESRRWR